MVLLVPSEQMRGDTGPLSVTGSGGSEAGRRTCPYHAAWQINDLFNTLISLWRGCAAETEVVICGCGP